MKRKNRPKYLAKKVNGEKRDIHRIVMEEYLGRPLTSDEVVHHINENTFDNRIENLALMSASEHNKLHRRNAAPRTDIRKLSSEQVRCARQLYKEGLSSRKIAAMYGVGKQVILYIIKGVYYKDVI